MTMRPRLAGIKGITFELTGGPLAARTAERSGAMLNAVLERKKKVLLANDDGRPLCAVLDPRMISPDGKFIRLGQFFSDEVSGYYPLEVVCNSVVSVLQEF